MFIPCFSHTENDIDWFRDALNFALQNYISISEEGFEKYLVGEPTKPVFRKYL